MFFLLFLFFNSPTTYYITKIQHLINMISLKNQKPNGWWSICMLLRSVIFLCSQWSLLFLFVCFICLLMLVNIRALDMLLTHSVTELHHQPPNLTFKTKKLGKTTKKNKLLNLTLETLGIYSLCIPLHLMLSSNAFLPVMPFAHLQEYILLILHP